MDDSRFATARRSSSTPTRSSQPRSAGCDCSPPRPSCSRRPWSHSTLEWLRVHARLDPRRRARSSRRALSSSSRSR
jgi:hypothetical protein